LVGNEENEYPVPDSDRMMLILNNKWNDIHKKISQRGNYEWNHWDSHREATSTVKQKVQDELKEYQDTTNKKLEKTQKQLSELREDFDKLQSERTETIKKRYMK
jgi:hypothetical protein